MLLEKYRPKSTDEIIGNRQQVLEIKKWLSEWRKGQGLIVHGQAGTGKSIAAKLAGEELGFDVQESHASDKRSYNAMQEMASGTCQKTLYFRKKMLIVDETEILDSIKGAVGLVKESSCPVIFITEDAYEKNLVALRKACKMVKFNKVRYDEITRLLKKITATEGINCSDATINQIARMAGGDVRAALIDFETALAGISFVGSREISENIFNTLNIIFKTTSLENTKIAFSMAEKPEDVFAWLEENIPNEYTKPEDVAAAYDFLSKADIFRTRLVRRRVRSMEKYIADMAVCGVALSKSGQYKKFVKYQPPKFYRMRDSRAIEKIAKITHTPRRQVPVELMKILIRKNPELAQKLGLEDGEAEGL
jgi:replication factor C large subunit